MECEFGRGLFGGLGLWFFKGVGRLCRFCRGKGEREGGK